MMMRSALGACALGLPCALAVAAQPALNLHATFADTKARLADGHQADILVLGDSLSFRTGAWLPYFRDAMQTRYGNAGAGYQGFTLWSGGAFNNGWLKSGINTDMSPHRSLDGLWNQYAPATGPVSAYYTPNDPQATFQLHYVTAPNGGTIELAAMKDWTTVASLPALATASATPALQTLDLTLAGDANRFGLFPRNDGPVTILGANNIRSAPGVRIHRAANGGWGVDNFLQRDWTFDAQVDALHPDLVMIWLGQNDQAYNRTTYAAKLNALVDRVLLTAPEAEILLIGTYDSGSPAIEPLVRAMEDVAVQRDLGFYSVYDQAGDYAHFVNSGYLDPDGIHFAPKGGQAVADMLYQAFITEPPGPALPEPGSLALLALGAAVLLRKR